LISARFAQRALPTDVFEVWNFQHFNSAMAPAAITVTTILLGLLLVQVILAAGFIVRLRRRPVESLPDSVSPKVALVICVRGKDPTLLDCINAALNQSYPDYGVHIIVDHRSDPAWPLVQDRVAANPQTSSVVQALDNPGRSCSLKCSSLIQAISALDASYEVVALLDTDIVPGRHWLRGMVAPLADPKVGATTGNRWFEPYPSTWAGLVRYAWNGAAVVLMHWLQIAWGGSLAIKRSVIDDGRLLSHWSYTYGEDTAINPALHRLGLRLEFVSSAIVPERGSCDFSQFLNWATRQLLSCRLHHDGWGHVLVHGIGTCLALGSAAALLAAGLSTGRWEVAVLTGAALATYVLVLFALLVGLELSVRRLGVSRNHAADWLDFPITAFKLIFAVALAQLLYAFTLFRAATLRTVEWRRARYAILGRSRIRLIEDNPLRDRSSSALDRAR
jgi:glycosyltransferase involved in cell wall biosynthesis